MIGLLCREVVVLRMTTAIIRADLYNRLDSFAHCHASLLSEELYKNLSDIY